MANSVLQIVENTLHVCDLNLRHDSLNSALEGINSNVIGNVNKIVLSKMLLLDRLPPRLAQFPNLEHIELSQCHSLKDISVLEQIAVKRVDVSRCYNLQCVKPALSDFTESLLLDYCTSLKVDSLLALTGVSKTIHTLSIRGLRQIRDLYPIVNTLNQLRQLRVLIVDDTCIDPNDLNYYNPHPNR